ncbi:MULTISPECIES: hypothetical protein [Pontibacter]|uniref:Uncharacterized protein n=1 Tax=Pontibacter lucknowensis TaxID=1077936 RepID=A0A1N6UF72_9BACT|nr:MULTISPECIES: hypothetical protein [Pontibacter]EJF10892.1 hypothetical protein O71_06362 [Pontibacter sp. BAB1700]SIQ64223.1 hypothetical protein SAMN05421545_0854 [Pontibacter lucknowensis]
MAFTKYIKHYLTYPLMWVMLLWAVTLPGHELAVYSYLVKGSAAEVAQSLRSATSEQDDFSVKQQTVQVFLDANTASVIVLSPQQFIKCVFQALTFATAIDDRPSYSPHAAGAELITQLFPITIQPNAP